MFRIGISAVLGFAISPCNDKHYSFVQRTDLLRMNGLGKTSISLTSEERHLGFYIIIHCFRTDPCTSSISLVLTRPTFNLTVWKY